MKTRGVVEFIGLHASFPVTKAARHHQILEALVNLEERMDFKEMKYGRTLGKIRKREFTPEMFQQVLKSIGSGDVDYLDLIPPSSGNWAESLKQFTTFSWTSSYHEARHRSPSPVEERFGFTGTITITYPLSRFTMDSESRFQQKLLDLIKSLFVEHRMYWCFVHDGQRLVDPTSVGVDDIFLDTRNGFPLSSFDTDLYSFSRYSKEFVRGVFWANFLNQTHVEELGGASRVIREAPCRIREEIGSNAMLLQVARSPRVADLPGAAEQYQRLRRFLNPILLETAEDWGRVHREVIGSWKAPRLSDGEWKKVISSFASTVRN